MYNNLFVSSPGHTLDLQAREPTLIPAEITCGLGPIVQRIYDLMIQIL